MAINHDVKTVTTAGTDVALASSKSARWVIIQAQTDNTGLIAVGGAIWKFITGRKKKDESLPPPTTYKP